MSAWLINRLILLMILLFASIMSLIWLKKLDKASKYISGLLCLTFATEALSLWAAYAFQQNNPIYNISNIISYILFCSYFNNIFRSSSMKSVMLTFGLVGVVLAITNIIFIQGLYILNTNFLAFESITIVWMSLYYYYDFLKSDTYLKKLPIHFWITSLILIFWSFALFHWLVGIYIMHLKSPSSDLPYNILLIVNMLTYLSFGILFFNYRKMSKVD